MITITNPELLGILADLIRTPHDRDEGIRPDIIEAKLNRRSKAGRVTHTATVLCEFFDARGAGPFYRVTRCKKVDGQWRHEFTISGFAEMDVLADLLDIALEKIETTRPAPARLRVAPPLPEHPPDDDGRPLVPERLVMPSRRLVGGRRDG